MVMRISKSTLGRVAGKRHSAVEQAVPPAVDSVHSEVRREDKPAVADAGATEEKCPVIRANRIIFSSATAGRLKVLFF